MNEKNLFSIHLATKWLVIFLAHFTRGKTAMNFDPRKKTDEEEEEEYDDDGGKREKRTKHIRWEENLLLWCHQTFIRWFTN